MIKKIKNLYFLVPAFIFLSVYWKSIFFGAVWDDDPMVISPQYMDFNLMLKGFYDNSHYAGVHYFPVFYLQCFIVNLLFGKYAYPMSFHIYHLLAQSIVCIFSTLVFFKLTKNKFLSVLVVAFWVIHPINVQMLTRVLVAPGVMACSWCLAFIYFYLKVIEGDNKKLKSVYLSFGGLLFLLALMTSEQFFLYPLLLYLLAIYLKGRSVFSKQYLYLLIPIVIVLPIYLVLRFIACGGNVFNLSTGDELLSWTEQGGIKDILFRAIWFSPQLIVHYFKLFFWPFGLMDSKAEWYMVGDSIFSLYSLFCQFFVLFLILSIFFLYKKVPLYSIGVSWFFIAMILFIQIFPLFTIAGVRYAYMSSLGLMLVIFSIIYSQPKIIKTFLLVVAALAFVFLITRTIYYLPSSKDYLSQFIYCAKEAPLWNKTTYYAKALDIAQKEKREQELPKWLNQETFAESVDKWLKVYLDLKPGLDIQYGPMQMAYNFYAIRGIFRFLFYSGQGEKLNKAMNLVLKIDNGWIGWYEIAKFLHFAKRWEKSWKVLKIAIEKAPRLKHSYNKEFIDIAIRVSRADEAEQIIKNYIRLNPKQSYPYLFSGYFYLKIGRVDNALKNFKDAIKRDKLVSPEESFMYLNAASLFLDNKLLEESKQTLGIILSYDPFNEEARSVLSELNSLRYTAN